MGCGGSKNAEDALKKSKVSVGKFGGENGETSGQGTLEQDNREFFEKIKNLDLKEDPKVPKSPSYQNFPKTIFFRFFDFFELKRPARTTFVRRGSIES